MSYEGGNYIETRFPGGMNSSVEPHTLDRDTGEMPDIFNMLTRTDGLRTRKGWKVAADLSGQYSALPTVAPVGLFEYDSGLAAEEEEAESGGETQEEEETVGGVSVPVEGDSSSSGVSGGVHKPTDDGPELVGWYTLAASPTPIMPYVPFTLTITGTGLGQVIAPNGLSYSFVPKGALSCEVGELTAGQNATWTRRIVVQTIDRDATKVAFRAVGALNVRGEGEFAYALYGFVPSLPATISQGTNFTFAISCKRSGATVTSYIGKGKGLSRRFVFLDAEGHETGGSVQISAASWSGGVLTGTATCLPGLDAVKLRLYATFAGEAEYADALLVMNAWNISAPETLHILGPAKQLTIVSESDITAYPDIAIYKGTTLSDDALEDSSGNALDFTSSGYTERTWQHDVRAVSSAAAGGYAIAAYFGDEEAASDTFSVHSGLVCQITAASAAKVSTAFSLSIAVTGDNGDTLTRFAANVVSVEVKDENGDDASSLLTISDSASFSSDASWSSGVWTHNVSFSAEGKYTITVKDAGGNVLASRTVNVVGAETQVILDLPKSLHVYGAGAELGITLLKNGEPLQDGDTDRPTLTWTDENGDAVDCTDYLELAEGGVAMQLDFSTGWTNGEWRHTVRAKSTASQGLLFLTASYTDSQSNTHTDGDVLEITRAMQASITLGATRVAPATDFTIAIAVSSPRGEALTRLPSTGGVTVAYGEQGGGNAVLTDSATGLAPSFADFSGGTSQHTCQVDRECVYEFSVSYGQTLLATETLNVTSADVGLSDLIDAINERYTAKNSSAYATTSNTLQQLKEHAAACIEYYLVGDVGSGGSYTRYNSSTAAAAIPALPQDQSDPAAVTAWAQSAYAVVKAAVRRVDVAPAYIYEKYYVGYGEEAQDTDIQTNAERIRLAKKARKKAIASYALNSEGQDSAARPQAYVSYTQNGYRKMYYGIYLRAVKYKVSLSDRTFASTQKYYRWDNAKENWETFGHKTSPQGTYGLVAQTSTPAGSQPDWCEYQGLSRPSHSGITFQSGMMYNQFGYLSDDASNRLRFCVIEYKFKHR